MLKRQCKMTIDDTITLFFTMIWNTPGEGQKNFDFAWGVWQILAKINENMVCFEHRCSKHICFWPSDCTFACFLQWFEARNIYKKAPRASHCRFRVLFFSMNIKEPQHPRLNFKIEFQWIANGLQAWVVINHHRPFSGSARILLGGPDIPMRGWGSAGLYGRRR